jgi:hypothetical protein
LPQLTGGGQAPQSAAQMSHDSPGSQTPSPQGGQSPQSAGQLEQLSFGVQNPFPHPWPTSFTSGASRSAYFCPSTC